MASLQWKATNSRDADDPTNYLDGAVPVSGDTCKDTSSGSSPTSGTVTCTSWDINGSTYNHASTCTYNCSIIDSAGTGLIGLATGDVFNGSIVFSGHTVTPGTTAAATGLRFPRRLA